MATDMTHHSEPAREAVANAQSIYDWLREPDYAERFSNAELLAWLKRRPSSIAAKLVAALSASPAPAAGGLEAVREAGTVEFVQPGANKAGDRISLPGGWYYERANDDVVVFVPRRPDGRGFGFEGNGKGLAVTVVQDFAKAMWSAALASPAATSAEAQGGDGGEIARWKRDSELLSAIEAECWDVRFTGSPNADAGDYNINIEIVGHFMAEPRERVVGENYSENLRAALEQAVTADAYPPARPIYDDPEVAAALAPSTSAATRGDGPKVSHLGAALQGIADEHADVLTPRQTEALYQAASKLWEPAPAVESAQVKEAVRKAMASVEARADKMTPTIVLGDDESVDLTPYQSGDQAGLRCAMKDIRASLDLATDAEG